MRHPLLAGLIGATIAFSVASLRPVDASTPVGVVNLQELLQQYPEYRQADQQVKDAEAAYQKALAERLKKLEEARAKGTSAAELTKLQRQYEAEIKPIQTKGLNLYKSLQARLKGQIETAISQVAKKKGLAVVYDKSAVLYGGTDLTKDVAAQLKR